MLRLMAGGAHLDLSCRCLDRILGHMQRVAARACDVARRMRAGCPIMRAVRLVARQALRILLDGRSGGFRAKINHPRQWAAAGLDVRAARPVTCLALKSAVAEWPARVIRLRMPGMEHAGHPGIVMAAETGVRSLGTVGGIAMRGTGGWSGGGRRRHDRGIGRERT